MKVYGNEKRRCTCSRTPKLLLCNSDCFVELYKTLLNNMIFKNHEFSGASLSQNATNRRLLYFHFDLGKNFRTTHNNTITIKNYENDNTNELVVDFKT